MATANYINGSDPSRWHTGLATYDALTAQHVAPGIDLVYSGTVAGQLEATYQVAPGANPSQIALMLGGADSTSLDGAGNLMLQTAAGPVTLSAPVAYQTINGQRVPVDVAYALPPAGIASPTAAAPTAADTTAPTSTTTVPASPAASATAVSTTPVPTTPTATALATPTLPATTTLGLVVGAYDPTQPLTIDPVLSWSTYLSGSQNDRARGVALDQQGNIYLTGNTGFSDFPTTTGAYTTTFRAGGNDAYVVKLSPDGKTRLYSTYLGGTDDDYGTDIAVNSSGNAYVTGWTWSSDFPTTTNAAQPTLGLGSLSLDDAYLTELSADGTSLVYSSYLGGTGYDVGTGLALGQQHLVYVGGINGGGGLPTTTNAYQQSYQGGDASNPSDGFLMAVDTSVSGASGLVYASYIGGSGNDAINGLAADAHGNVYVTGATDSTNFPISTTLPYTTYQGGTNDAFVAKLQITSSTAALVFSTYLGGSGDDQGFAIAADDSGAYITGQTSSSINFPIYNAAQSHYGGGATDAFVTRINDTGTALAYSSYLGGSADDHGYGITAGGPGGVNVVGMTASTDFITTTDALQPARSWSFSGFITQFNTQYGGSASLLYSSYLGGTTGDSEALAVATDGQNNAVVAGFTRSTDLQGTSGTVQPAPLTAGTEDAFVSKLEATPDCPVGFDCADIGDPVLNGDQLLSGSRANGTWYLQDAGSGTGDGYTSDQFHDVAMDALGDGSISARIVTQTNTSTSVKSGLMYRASEDPAAPYYDVVAKPYNTGGAIVVVQHRDTPGGAVVTTASAPTTLPVYVRMTRASTSFTSYTSSDGVHWSALANSTTQVDALTNTIQAGLMAAAYNTAVTTTATLDHVTINTCPTGWSCDDVGSPATTGDQVPLGDQFVNGLSPFFIVRGAGTGINSGATSDQFHYMHTPLSTDGSANARITDMRTTDGSTEDPAAAAGVMLRQTTDPSAPYYFVGLTAGNGLVVQDRTSTGTAATTLMQTAGITTPLYLRADRIGTTFLAYTSTDSITWVPLAGSSVTISSMSGDIEQGLAVSSRQAAVTTAGTFDYVRMDACPDTWTCADLSGTTPQGSQNLSNGVWSLRGTLQSRYVWQNANGDSGLSARITGLGATRPNATASLLYASQGTGLVPYYLAGMSPNDGLIIQTRTTTGGAVTYPAISATVTLPLYLNVVRAGNTFTTYTSPDDVLWTAVPNSSVTIAGMSDTADLGLDVNSADSTAWTTATFDTVNISGTTDTAPPAGTDLWNLDTHNEHYTQAANGLIDLQLYNSPVGIPDQTQWQQRDTTLITTSSTSVITPSNVPFTETIAPDTTGLTSTMTGPVMTSLTSEDGITLNVGLTATTPIAMGQVSGNAVTYKAVEPSNSDLSLRSTISGLDARVVMHDASETGPFLLTLASNANAQFTQNADGTIQVTQSLTATADDGVTPYTTTQTEYLMQPPILVDANTAVTNVVSTGPATTTLSGGSSGSENVSVSVDSSWLNDPHRVFPATLDIPIVTSYSSVNTGLFGTVNSCLPSNLAPQTEVVVGVAGNCTYHGQAYFDLSSLADDTSIVTATLHLYTPSQMMSTGVQVYQNAPMASGSDPSAAPSWNTAPVVMTNTAAIAQTSSDGHWQSWDVTSLVQGWVQDLTTNAGLTLVGNATPVGFASPLGAQNDDPTLAPYLDITFASGHKAHAPYYADGASSIYGVSGSFVSTYDCGSNHNACKGDTEPRAVANNLTGSLIRVPVQLNCGPITDPGYWDHIGGKITAGFENSSSLSSILQDAYNHHVNIVPIINLLIPDNNACQAYLGNPDTNSLYYTHWYDEMTSFVDHVLQPLIPTYPANFVGPIPKRFMYFEIGNEQNVHPAAYFGPSSQNNNYPFLFAAAAAGLRDEIAKVLDARAFNYRILTGGMLEPTASLTSRHPVCTNPTPNTGLYNVNVAVQAIVLAEANNLQPSQLGLAVHPYEYSTPNSNKNPSKQFWRNFYQMYPFIVTNPSPVFQSLFYNSYPGICRDLQAMIEQWTTKLPMIDHTLRGQHLPLVFTEINWNDNPQAPTDLSHEFCGDPFGCEGAYLADLLTWLNDHQQLYNTLDPQNSPLRVAWYRGADKAPPKDSLLGLYRSGGGPQRLDGAPQIVQALLFPNQLRYCRIHAHNLSDLYNQLRNNKCY